MPSHERSSKFTALKIASVWVVAAPRLYRHHRHNFELSRWHSNLMLPSKSSNGKICGCLGGWVECFSFVLKQNTSGLRSQSHNPANIKNEPLLIYCCHKKNSGWTIGDISDAKLCLKCQMSNIDFFVPAKVLLCLCAKILLRRLIRNQQVAKEI